VDRRRASVASIPPIRGIEVCHHLATASPGKLFRLAVGNSRVGDFLGSITALEVGEERTVPQAVSEMLRH